MRPVRPARRHGPACVALALLVTGTGCAEHQFLLAVRNPGPIEVAAPSERVARLPAVAPAAPVAGQVFSDRGVRLQTGTEFPYWRDGDWIASVAPVQVRQDSGRISIDYTLHPGRRDLLLSLSTDRQNVCELKTRQRPNRALGYAGLVLGVTVAAFVPITALSDHDGTRHAAPYVGGAAAALLIAGAAWVLWPAAPDQIVVSPSCATAATRAP